jgi:photosystem II stability/assembly factor-like uncharacterized protein
MRQIILFILIASVAFADTLDLELFKKLAPRNIGPAGMSGRVTSIDVTGENSDLIYIGTASGGVWRSQGGIDWEPIFDDAPLQNIGTVKIEPGNSDVIWVGTGEGNPRNSNSSGQGIYKSSDGGKSWHLMGLENVRSIHRIIVNNRNPNIVTVGATGNPWSSDEHRGIYQTKDGGKTWAKILPNKEFPMNDSTGVGDLIVDPNNPNKMIAGMWQYRRDPWFFTSGGSASGIFITYDGGETWKKISKGLPKGDLGRIGLTLCESKPNVVYALVESKKNAFYKSEDGGESWTKQTDKGQFGNRPFYYADIYCDPINENRIYSIWSVISRSEDGGKTWEVIAPYYAGGIHPDHHAFWINPNNPNHIIEGNDGGLNISYDMAKTWRFIENLPLAQFYHINIDNEIPYNVYGGMQDNGSWQGPSRAWRQGGIRNSYWEELAFGDGFDVVPDANDPRNGFAMSQEGNLYRYDNVTGEVNYVKPVHPDGETLRFHWNAAISHDPFDDNTFYYGSQYVHKSTDNGKNWKLISPDLTTNDSTKQNQRESGGLTYDVTGAENHTTILAISPSTLDDKEIWVSTDDGNVQLTTDDGANWKNLSGNMGVPKNSWIPQVHPSAYKKGECFVVVNDYRRGNWSPYLMHTSDYGKSWKNLVKGKGISSYVRSFVQDPVEPNLMFLGTEFGLYFSLDYGSNWQKWTEGYPSVSTMDMKIHPREPDLILGTFGRAAWIMDNISPLRQLANNKEKVLKGELTMFPIPDSYLVNWRVGAGGRFTAAGEYSGENKTSAARINFFLNKPKKEEDKKDSTDEEKPYVMSTDSCKVIITLNADTVRTFNRKVEKGLNIIEWGLDADGTRYPSQANKKLTPGGGLIKAGDYKVTIVYNEKDYFENVTVKYDPRNDYKSPGIDAKIAKQKELYKLVDQATMIMDDIRDYEKTINLVKGQLETISKEDKKEIEKLHKELADSLKSIKAIVNFDQGDKQGIVRRPDVLQGNLGNVNYYISSSMGAPGTSVDFMMEKCKKQYEEFKSRKEKFENGYWKEYQEKVNAIKFDPFDLKE